jgi:ArsR family transcriptional regulator, arsenate/arsenite/antimonite-responsive transcriptional repressor
LLSRAELLRKETIMEAINLIFKCFADKNRVRILKLLEKQKMCVCELAFILGITQPSVSRHLKKMKKAGLIESEQEGFWTNYYLSEKDKCAMAVMRNLKTWLNDDAVIKADLQKAKKANRQKLCHK